MADADRESRIIREMAHEWRARIEDGVLSPEEITQLGEWLEADIRHQEAYERADQLWAEMEDLDLDAIPEAVSGTGTQPPRALRSNARIRTPGLSLAAAFAAFLYLNLPPGFFDFNATHFSTEVAETKSITLEDGSVITLGGHSHVSFHMDGSARIAKVHEGEAFFDVATDPTRPFKVAASDAEISVLGTEFNVRVVNDDVDVAVSEGIVSVGSSANVANANRIELTAGKHVEVLKGGSVGTVTEIAMDNIAPWRNARFVYLEAELIDIVADVNRYQRGYVILSDNSLGQMTITGSFDANNIPGMLADITDSLGIDLSSPLPGVTLISAR